MHVWIVDELGTLKYLWVNFRQVHVEIMLNSSEIHGHHCRWLVGYVELDKH